MRLLLVAVLLAGCGSAPEGEKCLAEGTALLDGCLDAWCASRGGAFCECLRRGQYAVEDPQGGCECTDGDYVAEMADYACYEDLDGPLVLDCDGLQDSIVRFEERSCAP